MILSTAETRKASLQLMNSVRGDTILVFRKHLLPFSETFIQAQTQALKHYQPRFVGLVKASRSLPLPADSILLSSISKGSGVRQLLYAAIGAGGGFHKQVRKAGGVLLHAHFGLDGVKALPLVNYLKIPMVVTLHGYDVSIRDSEFHKRLGGKLYLHRRPALWDRAGLFLCVSEFVKTKALEAGFPAHKLRVHYIGIDHQLFTSTGGPAGREDVVFIGRLVEKKGCGHLIKAMAIVKQKGLAVRLAVIGDGPEKGRLQKLAVSSNIECDFLGVQSPEAVRKLLRSARVFCVPSITAGNGDSEGLGMVFLEAQAMGVPVASFRHGGIPEAVEHGNTGLLAQEGDVAGLADNITRLIQDRDFWERCSQNASAFTRRRFDLHRQTEKLETLYRMCISGHQGSGSSRFAQAD